MKEYKNILVLDDDNITTLLLENTLKKQYNTFALNDPCIDIVEYITTNDISLVLLDIEMPGRNGFEVADIIKNDENTKDIPIIFLTATNDKSFLIKAFENDAVDYVQKPFNKMELTARINTHLSNYVHLEKIKKQQEIIYAQAMNSGMNDILMKISHHWRQPLSIISLSAQSLNIENEIGTITKDEINNLTKDIIKTVKELSENIDFFADTYSNENHYEEFFVKEDMEKIIETIKNLLIDDSLKIVLKNEVEDDLTLKIDVAALRNVIIKIVTNSVEAYDASNNLEKELFINLTIKKNKLTICIKDYAGGIEQGDLQKVFEPYYSTKKDLNGTGLGLFVSRNIIRNQFKGDLFIENIDKDGKKRLSSHITIPL